MTKEHKKLYKAGKNWIVATLTATTITLLGGIGAYTVHADTTTEGTQSVQTASINQTSQSDNSDNTVTLNQPVTTQSNQNVQSAKSEQDIQASQSNQVTPAAVTEATVNDTNRLNPNIYGTVNVKDWDYQKGNNIINLTGYHGADLQHVIVPNLNDFNNANVDVNGVKNVDITSTVLKNVLGRLNSQNSTVAISKTDGSLNSKVVAEDNNWAATFAEGVKSKLEYADLTNLDTSKITNMAFLFDGQDHLKVLTGLDSWNTSNVISMKQMFQNDSELTALNLSNWDTSSATDMSFMFNMCNSARTFGDLSNWNTSNVTDMSGMFSDADSLQTVGNLDNWNTSNVTNMADMFNFTDNLQSIGNLSNWDTSKVTDMMGMFDGTKSLQTVGDLSKWDTSIVTDMEEMFYYSHIKTVGDLGKWNTSNVANMSYMFNNAINLQSVGDLSKWDTSNVTNMSCMFYNAINLQSVGDLSKWDTSRVTDMSDMFGSTRFSSIGDLSNWNTSNVTNMSYMFADTINLQSVGDLSKWDTSRVTDMSGVLLNSKINYFEVSRYNNSFINTLHLIDSNGLMGQPGETIATIKAPTFYKLEPDGNKMQSVYDTVFPLVQKKANEEYKNFLNGLTEGMRNIYPTKVTLKMVISEEWSPTPANNANATFTYNMKIGTLKDVVINYVDKVRNIVGSETLIGTVGSTIPLPKKLSLPSGYQLVKGQDIPSTITIQKGKLQTIDIYVEKSPEVPVVKTGSINYVDLSGKVIKIDKISGKVGDTIKVTLSLPDGYELANKDEQVPSTITVGDDGIKTIIINIKKINNTPITPVNPTEPNNPTNPAQPSNPTTPVNPSTPQNPTEPINPSTPSDTHNNNHGTTSATTTTPMAPAAKGNPGANQPSDNNVTGWRISSDGNHYVYYKDNQPLAGRRYVSLPTINGVGTSWYLVDNGVVQSGVQKWAGSYYYFDPVTYLKVTNDYRQSQWGDWYLFGNDGRILTGVQKWAGSYYYFDPVTYLKVTNDYRQSQWGSWYLFGNDGRILTGVQKWAGSYYYFDPVTYLKVTNDYRQSQWGSWYLFGNDGRILTGVQKWAGTYYYFDPVTYLKVTNSYRQSQWGDWYMFGPDGRIVSGLYNWLGNLYYFDPVTYLKVTNQYVYVGGVRYWADANGCLSRA
jgi:surface protein